MRGEFEYVRAKPLGDGFTGVPVSEIRGAVLRPFLENRMSIAANFLIASGYTGQTTEILALPTDPAPFERMSGAVEILRQSELDILLQEMSHSQ